MYRIWWFVSVLSIVSAIFIGYVVQPLLPAELPSHWNAAGEVDGWQSSHTYVWLMPVMALVLVGVMAILTVRMSDLRVRSRIAMSAALLTVYMLGLHLLIGMRAYAGQMMTLAEFMRLMAGLFVGLAFIIKDVPQNHVVGFRLPWTMNDTDTWIHTHKVGFWGMLAGGIVCVIVTFLPIATEIMFGLGIGVILLGTILPSLDSFWYARKKRARTR
jgi:uncharacterized membrane protein